MLNELKRELNVTSTENGALVHKTTYNNCLDLFALVGSMRYRDDEDIIELFGKAYQEDQLTAMKILFYLRDVRGGIGERNTFRVIIRHMAKMYTTSMRKNIQFIPEFGRWDDLYALMGTPLQNDALEIIKTQLYKDINSEQVSLLAKWMPSENTSSSETRRNATITRKYLKMSPKTYRKTLTKLRKKINIVETKLCENNYKDIDYSKLPSGAGLKYRNAFYRNDEDRYSQYVEDVSKGKTKVNSSTLYPYELVREAEKLRAGETQRKMLNEMWKSLPDFIGNNDENCLAVVDVSGSMTQNNSLPMQMAVSLGLYVAEKNKGRFANHFITFSAHPELVEIKGDDFVGKVKYIERSKWGYNTDIEAVFDLILNTAKKYKMSQEELPSRLFILSDMRFDEAIEDFGWTRKPVDKETLFQTIAKKYKKAGYKVPTLVFWNINAEDNLIPAIDNENGMNVQYVSGSSARIFELLLKGETLTALDLMFEAINNKRYNCITV